MVQETEINWRFLLTLIGVFVVFIAIALVVLSVVIVGPGSRGVLLQWGAVTGNVFDEGLHFITPFAQSVDIIDIKTQKVETTATAASSDLQDVTSKIALNYHLNSDQVAWLRQKIGLDYRSKVIDPAIQEVVKASTSQFTAEQLVTERAVVRDRMQEGLREKLSNQTQGSIVVEAFSIIDFQFSAEFSRAIESKVTAEQNALAAKNKLEQVKYEAEQRVAQANGEAQAIIIQSQALRENKDILQLRWIEKWDGKLPSVMAGDSGGMLLNLPISNIGGEPN